MEKPGDEARASPDGSETPVTADDVSRPLHTLGALFSSSVPVHSRLLTVGLGLQCFGAREYWRAECHYEAEG
jgi:hypothetical protein